MSKSAEFHVNPERGTIRVTITERRYYGGTARKTQHTFPLKPFERALRQAGVTVPWDQVKTP